MEKKQVPLPQSFLFIGLMGFLVTAIYGYYGSLPLPWATAFGTVFLLMVIASFVSIGPSRV